MRQADPEKRRFSALRGRRKGRRLRAGREDLLKTVLPELRLDPDALRTAGDWRSLFQAPVRELWLEIGFGSGEHMVRQIEDAPHAAFIGCEPFINGMAALLVALPEPARPRVRLYDDDAMDVLCALPDASLSRCFILFPDPWPKRRHSDRRFIGPRSLVELTRALAPGAELRFASDDPGMIDWALMHLCRHPGLLWQANTASDWRVRPADWPPTRYETKALGAGRKPAYLRFIRAD